MDPSIIHQTTAELIQWNCNGLRSQTAELQDPAICRTCGEPITVSHILIKCRLYETERRNYKLGNSLHELLGNDTSTLEKTKQFLKDCKLDKLI